MFRKSYEIAGYTYNGSILCPGCTVAALRMTPEENLSELAFAFGIDREDESSFDSDEFPKVVFVDQLSEGETCESCGGEL